MSASTLPLPQNLPDIPGLTTPLPTAPPPVPAAAGSPPASSPLLHHLQSPVESVNHYIDQWLIAHKHGGPALLWVVHLFLAVATTLVVAWAAGALCRSLGRYLGKRHHKLPSTLLLIAAPALRWVLLLAGLSDAVEDGWPAIKGPFRWLAGSLFVIAVILAVRGMIAVARTFLDTLLKPRLVQSMQDELEPTSSATGVGSQALVPLIQRLAGVLLWLAGLILVLDHFGQNVSSVVAALGVTSLAIGLASQQALSNIIAGLVLALDHPFRIGDRIRLPGLDGGEVLDVGMRATQIRLSDGSLLIVPNADLVSARLVNQSVEHAVRAEVRLTVPVSVDLDILTTFLVAAAAKIEPPALTDRPPRVHLLSISDKLELALILWLPRHADAPRVEEQLRRAALRHIQELLAELAAINSPREPARSTAAQSAIPVVLGPKAPESAAPRQPIALAAAKSEPVAVAKAEPVAVAKAEPVAAAKAEPVAAAKAEPVAAAKVGPVAAGPKAVSPPTREGRKRHH